MRDLTVDGTSLETFMRDVTADGTTLRELSTEWLPLLLVATLPLLCLVYDFAAHIAAKLKKRISSALEGPEPGPRPRSWWERCMLGCCGCGGLFGSGGLCGPGGLFGGLFGALFGTSSDPAGSGAAGRGRKALGASEQQPPNGLGTGGGGDALNDGRRGRLSPSSAGAQLSPGGGSLDSPSLLKLRELSIRPGIPKLSTKRRPPEFNDMQNLGRRAGDPSFNYTDARPSSTLPPPPPPKSHLWTMQPPEWLLQSARWGWHSLSSARGQRSARGGQRSARISACDRS